jgi:hypothetical protein
VVASGAGVMCGGDRYLCSEIDIPDRIESLSPGEEI